MNKRRMKHSGYTIAITALIIAGIILLNALAGMLADRFSLKMDLTAGELYSLAEETRAVLAEMEEDVRLTVLSNEAQWENRYSLIVAEAVRNYESLSGGRVSLRFLDPDTNPQLAEEYPALTTLTQNDIIVESAKRYTTILSDNLLAREPNYNTGNYDVVGLRIDQTLTTALMYVLNETAPKAVFVSNHGETTDTMLIDLFESMSYTCENLDLLTGDIPADTNFLLFHSPLFDISEAEGQKLDDFKSRGGDIIILYGPTTPKLNLLELFMSEWGIGVGPQIVHHDNQSVATDSTLLYAALSDGGAEHFDNLHYVSTASNNAYVYAEGARPISSLYEGDLKNTNNRLYRLVNTDAEAYLTANGSKVTDPPPPYTLAMVNHHYEYIDNNPVDSYLLVANAGLFSDMLLGQSNMNKYSFVAMIMDLNPQTDSIYIPSKSIANTPLAIMGWQSQIVFVLLCVLVPLFIAALGLLTWRRRKGL